VGNQEHGPKGGARSTFFWPLNGERLEGCVNEKKKEALPYGDHVGNVGDKARDAN